MDMKKRFGVTVGLSDHSFGSMGAVVAVSLGARVVEKHVKLDDVDSPDSAFSMTMDEYANMIKDANNAKLISARSDYKLSEKEMASTVFRRSLFAVKDINIGDVITEDNIRSIRPGNGIRPKYLKQLIGKKANIAVKYGHPITQEFLDGLRGVGRSAIKGVGNAASSLFGASSSNLNIESI